MSFNKKKKSSSKSSKSSKKDSNFLTIGQYLVAKNGKTKYLKLGTSPKADKEKRLAVKKLIAALGTDIIYINIFDEKFKKKYKVMDFVKGSASINLDAELENDEDEDQDLEDEETDDEDSDEDESEDDSDDEDEDEDDTDF